MTKSATQKNKLSREEAEAIYDDLRKTMSDIMRKNPEGAEGVRASSTQSTPSSPRISREDIQARAEKLRGQLGKLEIGSNTQQKRQETGQAPTMRAPGRFQPKGQKNAVLFVMGLAIFRVCLSGLEAAGIGQVQVADAAMTALPKANYSEKFSTEEIEVLTSLDNRRAELERRSKRLDQREEDLTLRDQEYAVRLTQLRDLTNRLKNDREKNETQKNQKLEQLANVYGSMNPPEAAGLMDQLDITIALDLLSKMPEKRIAQILGMMRAEKALALTKMMSERVK